MRWDIFDAARMLMALYLVNPAVDLTLELYVSSQAEEAMSIQWERIKDRNVRETFVKRLESGFERVLADSLDWDIKPPTPAQLNYATLVAKKLKMPLPHEARLYRFHAALFLETYASHAGDGGEASADACPPGNSRQP